MQSRSNKYYIGNSIKQVIKLTTESKFEELEAISLDSSGVKTIDLAQFEVSVNDNTIDHFNVSLNETIFDLQHRKFRKLDMSQQLRHRLVSLTLGLF